MTGEFAYCHATGMSRTLLAQNPQSQNKVNADILKSYEHQHVIEILLSTAFKAYQSSTDSEAILSIGPADSRSEQVTYT